MSRDRVINCLKSPGVADVLKTSVIFCHSEEFMIINACGKKVTMTKNSEIFKKIIFLD